MQSNAQQWLKRSTCLGQNFSMASTAEHSRWNWNDKYQLVAEAPLAYRIMGIEAEGQMQGLILLLASFAKLTARRANH